ncbi:hypothetical protein [Rhodanobacter sp. C05]|nr:hypothetical protein [Rhodanobacter sp. C05]
MSRFPLSGVTGLAGADFSGVIPAKAGIHLCVAKDQVGFPLSRE